MNYFTEPFKEFSKKGERIGRMKAILSLQKFINNIDLANMDLMELRLIQKFQQFVVEEEAKV